MNFSLLSLSIHFFSFLEKTLEMTVGDSIKHGCDSRSPIGRQAQCQLEWSGVLKSKYLRSGNVICRLSIVGKGMYQCLIAKPIIRPTYAKASGGS
jgi:hypothetical protein